MEQTDKDKQRMSYLIRQKQVKEYTDKFTENDTSFDKVVKSGLILHIIKYIPYATSYQNISTFGVNWRNIVSLSKKVKEVSKPFFDFIYQRKKYDAIMYLRQLHRDKIIYRKIGKKFPITKNVLIVIELMKKDIQYRDEVCKQIDNAGDNQFYIIFDYLNQHKKLGVDTSVLKKPTTK
jgi:hypothetical protein